MVLTPPNISKSEAMEVLKGFEDEGLNLLEATSVSGRVSLDGWNPFTWTKQAGNAAGVIVRFWGTGHKTRTCTSRGAQRGRLKAMHESVRDSFISFSEPLEGRVRFMYLDVKRLVSTGVGNLLDADDAEFGTNPSPLPDIYTLDWFDKTSGAPASRADILAEYARVKFSDTAQKSLPEKEKITRLQTTDGEIDKLIHRKLASFERTLLQREPFASLDQWPADGQLGLLSMAWALGPKFRFPKFQAAAVVGDWLIMARECRMTEAGNPGVIPRNVRNSLLFTIASWWVAPPPGDFTQLVFDPRGQLASNMRSGYFPIPMNLTIGLQAALEILGYNPNGLDGIAGNDTRKALNSFEFAHDIPPTTAMKSIDDVPHQTLEAIIYRLGEHEISHYP
jgi:hypothetical protein